MAELPNQHQEMYCKHRARGMTPAQAAGKIFYTLPGIHLSFEKDADITRRIKELEMTLRNQAGEAGVASTDANKTHTAYSDDWIISNLAKIVTLAIDSNLLDTAVKALGLITDIKHRDS